MQTTSPLEAVQFAENPEPRCACVVLVDTSGSMYGQPIEALNHGLHVLESKLKEDSLASKRVEIAVVEFASTATVVQDFVSADSFVAPVLDAGGSTSMGEGIEKGIEMIRARKATYRANGVATYSPWLWMITDGAPTDDISKARQMIQDAEAKKSLAFFPIGVEGANMEQLRDLSVRTPVKLNGLNFTEMFKWLSDSLGKVASSRIGEQVALPSVGWGKV